MIGSINSNGGGGDNESRIIAAYVTSYDASDRGYVYRYVNSEYASASGKIFTILQDCNVSIKMFGRGAYWNQNDKMVNTPATYTIKITNNDTNNPTYSGSFAADGSHSQSNTVTNSLILTANSLVTLSYGLAVNNHNGMLNMVIILNK